MSENQIKNMTRILWFAALIFLVGILIQAKPPSSPVKIGADAPQSCLITIYSAKENYYSDTGGLIGMLLNFHVDRNNQEFFDLTIVEGANNNNYVKAFKKGSYYNLYYSGCAVTIGNIGDGDVKPEPPLPLPVDIQKFEERLAGSILKIENGYGQVLDVKRGKDRRLKGEYNWIYAIVPAKILPETGWSWGVWQPFSGGEFLPQVIYAFQEGGGFEPPNPDPGPSPIPGKDFREWADLGVVGGLIYSTPPIVAYPFFKWLGEAWNKSMGQWETKSLFAKSGRGYRVIVGAGGITSETIYVANARGLEKYGLAMVIIRTVTASSGIKTKVPYEKIIPSVLTDNDFAEPQAGLAKIVFSDNRREFRIPIAWLRTPLGQFEYPLDIFGDLIRSIFGMPPQGRYIWPEYMKSISTCALTGKFSKNGIDYWVIDFRRTVKALPVGSKVTQNGREVGIYMGLIDGKHAVLPSKYVVAYYNSLVGEINKILRSD